MRASELLESFPAVPDGRGGLRHPACQGREALIIQTFRDGHCMPVRWAAVHARTEAHEGILRVSEDALSLGEPGDWVRPAVSCRTAQLVADHYGCLLPTALISDLAWQQAAVRLPPHPQDADAHMADAERFFRHHAEVEASRGARVGLVATVGKDWILSNRMLRWPGWAVNYGWHRLDGRAVQALGPAAVRPFHDVSHVDYSQVAPRIVHPMMLVDGEERAVEAVMADPELCGLVSNEGPIPATRYPGIEPEEAGAEPPA